MRLIDADKIILDYSGLMYIDPLDFRGTAEYFANQIKEMPTIEPERKRGKWIPENRTMDAFWVCSSCGFPSEAHAANILYKFCPNCGAKMKEGEAG